MRHFALQPTATALNTKCSFVCKFIQTVEMPENGMGGKIFPGFARNLHVSEQTRRKKSPASVEAREISNW
jgi:hypothetical protein